MASVTITIPNSNWIMAPDAITWQTPTTALIPNPGTPISLGRLLSANPGTEIFLVQLRLPRKPAQTVRLSLVDSQTQSILLAGQDFSSQMEQNGTIAVTASNGDTLSIAMGGADSREPYQWTPSNSAEVHTFANTLAGLSDRSLTVTFDDGAFSSFLGTTPLRKIAYGSTVRDMDALYKGETKIFQKA